jgi:GWxTD domain-containing protein
VVSSHPRFHSLFLLVVLVGSGCFAVQAQEKNSKAGAAAQADGQQDPLKRERKKDDKAANIEKLGGVYKKWLDEDVRWIITDEELSAFKKLANNSERDVFIEGFWQRRDPTPDTAENEYKEEHYRRIAYANTMPPACRVGALTAEEFT